LGQARGFQFDRSHPRVITLREHHAATTRLGLACHAARDSYMIKTKLMFVTNTVFVHYHITVYTAALKLRSARHIRLVVALHTRPVTASFARRVLAVTHHAGLAAPFASSTLVVVAARPRLVAAAHAHAP